jgi:hypothetical protein
VAVSAAAAAPISACITPRSRLPVLWCEPCPSAACNGMQPTSKPPVAISVHISTLAAQRALVDAQGEQRGQHQQREGQQQRQRDPARQHRPTLSVTPPVC